MEKKWDFFRRASPTKNIVSFPEADRREAEEKKILGLKTQARLP